MNGSDVVLLAAMAFALIGSGVVYAFGKSIERKRKRRHSSRP